MGPLSQPPSAAKPGEAKGEGGHFVPSDILEYERCQDLLPLLFSAVPSEGSSPWASKRLEPQARPRQNKH